MFFPKFYWKSYMEFQQINPCQKNFPKIVHSKAILFPDFLNLTLGSVIFFQTSYYVENS